MRSLTTINDLSATEICELITTALSWKQQQVIPQLEQNIIACNIFDEPSTRTYASFKLATTKLEMTTIDLFSSQTSLQKGESITQTILNLQALGAQMFIIRHSVPEFYLEILASKDQLKLPMSIINAGDGANEHPTQCLLDLMTIYEQFHYFENLTVLFIGDTKNSRVFHSHAKTMAKFKMNIKTLVPSKEFKQYFDQYVQTANGLQNIKITSPEFKALVKTEQTKIKAEFAKADVIIALRTQLERTNNRPTFEAFYTANCCTIDQNKLKWLQPTAIVMHPGPFNDNVEISSEILFHPQVKIFTQVNNGLYLRSALISFLIKN